MEAAKTAESRLGIKPLGYLIHHLSPLPSFVEEIRDKKKPHIAIYHGSDLNFAIRKNNLLERQFLETVLNLSGVITLTEHGKAEVESYLAAHDVPPIHVVPPGVNTDLFRPLEKKEALQKFRDVFNQLHIDESLATARIKIIEAIYDSDHNKVLTMLFQELEKIEAAKVTDPFLLDFFERNIDAPIIIFAGKYLWTKGIAALLLAMPFVWHRFPQARLLLVGFGGSRGILEKIRSSLSTREFGFTARLIASHREIDPGSKEDVIFDAPVVFAERLAQDSCYPDFPPENFMEKVFFAGYLDHERLAPLLAAGDVFVAPSLFRESFGLVLLEAAAAGVLPVASCHSGFKDVLEKLGENEGYCVELDEHFIENLGQALIDALSKEADRNKLHTFVRDNYSWKAAAENLYSLFIKPSERKGE